MATGKACPICSRLQEVETSFYKYLAPQLDRPLPEAAGLLVVLPAAAGEDPEKRHVRRCPECGALYDYLSYYEYQANGGEDNEELTRLSPARKADFIRSQARLLEEMRRDVILLQDQAGALGDLIDRGRADGEEGRKALADMENGRREADARRRSLLERLDGLRRACPEIPTAWAAAHARVCRHFLESLPDRGEDERTARFVARSWLESWEKLAAGGEPALSGAGPWLPGYDGLLDRELAAER